MILTGGDFEDSKLYDEHEMTVTVSGPRAVAATWEDIQAAVAALAGPSQASWLLYRLEEPTKRFLRADEELASKLNKISKRLQRPRHGNLRTNPLDTFDDIELHDKLRFRRQDILELTDLLTNDLKLDNRGGAVPPVLQVCVTLRYFATGTFQNAIGEMIGISRPTVSLIVKRTMNALLRRFAEFIRPPEMQDINRSKIEFQEMAGFPNVFGCIDGTHIKIVAPPGNDEDMYVNRKNVHSINVQIVCDVGCVFGTVWQLLLAHYMMPGFCENQHFGESWRVSLGLCRKDSSLETVPTPFENGS
ncbi:low quality protein: putative nuclease harbi1 [Plakobranchus ocellatus]|uniref:Low quality protein: putative nuclease harbi1 n=1 Tax=Plakobranchus ocellatus TaxID=259542 RepID=A0AAV3YS92_9GAST|nr:low quality protein: putative nuclease harbi1 [Plakobranchus ocellatus]